MSAEILYVVGDRFIDFAEKMGVVTVSQLQSLEHQYFQSLQKVVVGQGVGLNGLNIIHAQLKHYIVNNGLELNENISSKSDKKLVHKYQDQNVMVTHPVCINDNFYECAMVVDDNCAELSDHITGIHMQGALFIESARQMFMAASKHFLKSYDAENFVYTLQKIQVNFKGFLYPLPIKMRLHVGPIKNIRGVLRGDAVIEFEQFNKIGVEVQCNGRAFAPDLLQDFEESKALETISRIQQQEAAVLPSVAMN